MHFQRVLVNILPLVALGAAFSISLGGKPMLARSQQLATTNLDFASEIVPILRPIGGEWPRAAADLPMLKRSISEGSPAAIPLDDEPVSAEVIYSNEMVPHVQWLERSSSAATTEAPGSNIKIERGGVPKLMKCMFSFDKKCLRDDLGQVKEKHEDEHRIERRKLPRVLQCIVTLMLHCPPKHPKKYLPVADE